MQLFAGITEQGAERVVEPQKAALRVGERHADGCLVEGIAKQILDFVQLAARRDEIGEIADGADVGAACQRLDVLGIEAHRASHGAGTIFECHWARLHAIIRRACLHAVEILRVHALRPLVRALIRAQPEYAAVLGVAIVDPAGGIDVVESDRGAVEHLVRGSAGHRRALVRWRFAMQSSSSATRACSSADTAHWRASSASRPCCSSVK